MVKKVKKYLKFVVCCALILSLIAPSYAALSASDGSAFVTKAEFDSALADFNARLTTFEAGINSKIDSQVTSYLDRNGIWNGQKQTLNILNENTFVGVKNFSLSLNNVSEATWWVENDHEGILSNYTPSDNDGMLKFVYDRLLGNTPYYWTNTTPTGGSIPNDPSAAFIKQLGNPLNVIPDVSKSGLLFTRVYVSAPDPRYGTTIYIRHGEYSNEYSIHDADGNGLLGANAANFYPYLSSAAYWCVTPAEVTMLSDDKDADNYWQKFIVGSFKPMDWLFLPEAGQWLENYICNQDNRWIYGWASTYSPNMYISNFFVSKTEKVWLVPAVIFTLSAGWYYYWFWSSTHWEFISNGNVNKKNYLTMKMNASVY